MRQSLLRSNVFVLLIIFLLSSPFLLFGEDLDIAEAQEALDVVIDGVYSVVASYLPPFADLQGVDIDEKKEGEHFFISFNRSQLSSYIDSLSQPPNGNTVTLYERLLASVSSYLPMSDIAIRRLTRKNYIQSEVFLDGTLDIEFNTKLTIPVFVELSLLNKVSDLKFSAKISLLVSGERFSEYYVFNGLFSGYIENNKTVRVSFENMTCNGIPIDVNNILF